MTFHFTALGCALLCVFFGCIIEDEQTDTDDQNGDVDEGPYQEFFIYDDLVRFAWGGSMDGKNIDLNSTENPYDGVYAMRIDIDETDWWNEISIQAELPGLDLRGASAICFATWIELGSMVSWTWMDGCGNKYGISGDGEWYYECQPIRKCPNLASIHDIFGFRMTGPGTILIDEISIRFPRPDDEPTEVVIENTDECNYQLSVNGDEYFIKGFGYDSIDESWYETDFGLVAAASGNTLRNWGASQFTFSTLDQMLDHGLHLLAGFWLFRGDECDTCPTPDYTDPVYRQAVERAVTNFVECYKDHPAILAWLPGNEVWDNLSEDENDPNKKAFVSLLNDLAVQIHKIDANHPVGTAGVCHHPLVDLAIDAPDIDFYGANAYGCISEVMQEALNAGWDRPIVYTEYGCDGWWERDDWFDESYGDEEKADDYAARYREYIAGQRGLVLGGAAFAWIDRLDPGQSLPGWGIVNDDRSFRPQYERLSEAYSEPLPDCIMPK